MQLIREGEIRVLYSGQYRLGSISCPVDVNGVSRGWHWWLDLIHRTGVAKDLEAAREEQEAVWRAWLKQGGLAELGRPAEPPQLRTALARDLRATAAWPDSQHVVYSGEVEIGQLIEDPAHALNPGLEREPEPPWSWHLHKEFVTPRTRGFGRAPTNEAALAAMRSAWDQWLRRAGLAYSRDSRGPLQ